MKDKLDNSTDEIWWIKTGYWLRKIAGWSLPFRNVNVQKIIVGQKKSCLCGNYNRINQYKVKCSAA